jgi:hypothetical protein
MMNHKLRKLGIEVIAQASAIPGVPKHATQRISHACRYRPLIERCAVPRL